MPPLSLSVKRLFISPFPPLLPASFSELFLVRGCWLMAADVSSLVRVMSGYKEEGETKGKRDLITRDLLGGCAVLGSKELDLDLQVPAGWEKRLDLPSSKTYAEKAGSAPVHRQLQDLNLLPEDSAALDLQLLPPASSTAACPFDYQSVCTLEKVKHALERAERESRSKQLKPSDFFASPTSSTTSSSTKRRACGDGGEEVSGEGSTALVAAGCPSCLLYVLIARGNPRCPRCDSRVPLPALPKKPRIDLNAA